jgi:hypothetical protein
MEAVVAEQVEPVEAEAGVEATAAVEERVAAVAMEVVDTVAETARVDDGQAPTELTIHRAATSMDSARNDPR